MVNNETLLEVVSRLEKAIKDVQSLSSSSNTNEHVKCVEEEKEIIRPFTSFWNKTKESLLQLSTLSKELPYGEELVQITEMGIEGICFHQDIFDNQEHYKYPSEEELKKIQERFLEIIKRINEVSSKKREIEHFSQCIVNGINSLLWISVLKDGLEVAQVYSEMIDNSRNKILLKKIKEESEYVNSWRSIFTELLKLIKAEYKTGLPYNFKSDKGFSCINEKLGENYKYYKENNKFKTLTNKQAIVKTEIKSESKLESKPIPKSKNSDFIELVIKNIKILHEKAKSDEGGVENLDKLTIELEKAYLIFIYILENSKRYKYPSEEKQKEISSIFLEKVKEIKQISSSNLNDTRLFQDHVENSINSFHWVTRNQECLDLAQFYVEQIDLSGNKIMMKKNQTLTGWIKANKEILTNMIQLLKMNYKLGLDWNYQNGSSDFDKYINEIKQSQNNKVDLCGQVQNEGNSNENIYYFLSKEGINKQTKEEFESKSNIDEEIIIDSIEKGIFSIRKNGRVIIRNSKNLKINFVLDDVKVNFDIKDSSLAIENKGKVYNI